MRRLLLADRVKSCEESFLAPLLPALRRHYDTRFIRAGPGEELAAAIAWADVVWLEWCWDHAVWATREALPAGKPCILRLHSVEALQTSYPGQVDWSRVHRLVTVSDDITETLLQQFPEIAGAVPIQVIANGIDMARFRAGSPDRFRVAWVGHLEAKKNPMLLMQVAHRTRQLNPPVLLPRGGRLHRPADCAVSEPDAAGPRPRGRGALRRPGRRHAGLVCGQGDRALHVDVRELRHEHRRGDGRRGLSGRPPLPRR